MTKSAIIRLAVKALQSYATEHYGWETKFHEDAREKYDALMEAIKMLEAQDDNQTAKILTSGE